LISITSGSYDVLLNKLRSGSLDFVVGLLKDPPPADDVVEELLLRDTYVIAARRGHPLAAKARVTSADLTNFDWISPTTMSARRPTYEGMFGEELLPQSNIETHSLATVLMLLASSNRLTVLTQCELMFDRRLGHNLTALNVDPISTTAAMGVTTRRGWLPTRLQRAFVESLRWQALQQSSELGAVFHEGSEHPALDAALDLPSSKIVATH
jgi:DNA-binding transcriptional LysR family regulator